MEIFYLIHAIIASLFAMRGHRFQSRFIRNVSINAGSQKYGDGKDTLSIEQVH